MDLIGGYLLVIIILFSANFSLLLGNVKLSNIKLVSISFIMTVIVYSLFYLSDFFNFYSIDIMNYFFIAVSILIFSIAAYYVRRNNLKVTGVSFLIVFLISVFILSAQTDLSIFDKSLFALFIFITTFIVYKVSKLLAFAKREYPILIGEYMSLSSVLLFIFGLTYFSTLNLDYSMFSPFLILTPTYQLIYIIIFIVAILVIGVVYNDNTGGSL